MTTANIVADLERLAVPIGTVAPLPDNPRRGDVDAVARSYKRFGQRKPIVVRRDGGTKAKPRGTVIAGNHQLHAALQLGWDRIAVVWVADDDLTAKAYALADNRTAELGGYDDELLADMLSEVATDVELFAATAWTEDDLARMLAGDKERDADTGPALDEQRHSILVECRDERHQRELLETFEAEGLACRPLMM